MYFMSKVFRGIEGRYQNIVKLALVILVVMARYLRPDFQGHNIFVKTIYHVQRVLKIPYLPERIIYWVVELLEHDIQYVPNGSIKSQALRDLLVKSSLHEDK